MYTTILPPLALSDFKRDYRPFDLHNLFPEQGTLFARGRQALAAGIELLKLGAGDTVLMPASMCSEVLKIFAIRGIGICYYKLDRNLMPDLTDIEQKIDSSVKALYVNHYFGFPAPVRMLKLLCEQYGIYMIEDCALALVGRLGGAALGSFGDIAIFSLWKFLPLPDGGALVVNNTALSTPSSPPQNGSLSPFIWIMKNILYNLGGQTIKKLTGRGQKIPDWEDEIDMIEEEAYAISRISQFILHHLNMEEMQEQRRRNFEFWLGADMNGFYRDLPDEVVPFTFPILCEDKAEKDQLYAKLAAQGIYLEPSINYTHYNIDTVKNKDERFEDIKYLGDRVLSLPVHQNLTHKELEIIRRLCSAD